MHHASGGFSNLDLWLLKVLVIVPSGNTIRTRPLKSIISTFGTKIEPVVSEISCLSKNADKYLGRMPVQECLKAVHASLSKTWHRPAGGARKLPDEAEAGAASVLIA